MIISSSLFFFFFFFFFFFSALRMLRLVRLLTFIKGVKQLRVIVSGLLTGLKSVSYIVMLLMLIIYINAILACLFYGANDPARFGTVTMAMLSLFQVPCHATARAQRSCFHSTLQTSGSLFSCTPPTHPPPSPVKAYRDKWAAHPPSVICLCAAAQPPPH